MWDAMGACVKWAIAGTVTTACAHRAVVPVHIHSIAVCVPIII